MKTTEILALDSPALDGRDEVYYIAFLKNGEVKFLNQNCLKFLPEVMTECKSIYRYNYWKIDAKFVDGNFVEVEFDSNERKDVEAVNIAYRDSRFKAITY